MFCIHFSSFAQPSIAMYAGNQGKETFYDVSQLSDGTFLVCGSADNLNWIQAAVPKVVLAATGINNGLGTQKFGYILHLSNDLQTNIRVVHFAQNAVEDIRFMKFSNKPYTTTGELFISGTTKDTKANDGGYFIAKLNNNFVDNFPTALTWVQKVWAEGGPIDYQPWDVTNKGEVYYVSGQNHAYDWSAMYCLNSNGQRRVINNWRSHWSVGNTEWKGTPASSYANAGDPLNYSGIVFKNWGRCELRSWTVNDYNAVLPDGNGGTKKGKWPLDILFASECDPNSPTQTSPGYTGYSNEACCPVYGATSICVDRRNNDLYFGMNMKSIGPTNSPDFEPAVVAMDSTGNLKWWSRLYHEITPLGDTMISIPDQYVDALAIDYANDKLVVAARAHGNNTENLWEGNTIANFPNAYGFQNQFTGTNGNIHESWLGKLKLSNGDLTNSTYVAELAEGTGGLGTAHPDANLDGWPNPNTGWPDVNTTRLAKNNLKVSSNGSVSILGVGRRTITTANAYQKMVKPTWGGKSCWNSFVRIYEPDFHVPLYSSLCVGMWDTITQAGGDNTELFGTYKTAQGIISVGRQKADANGIAVGNNIPTNMIPAWGSNTPSNESAILIYYKANNLIDINDSVVVVSGLANEKVRSNILSIYPNPSSDLLYVEVDKQWIEGGTYLIYDITGELIIFGKLQNAISVSQLKNGLYTLVIQTDVKKYRGLFSVIK